jgi:hypothetical protein
VTAAELRALALALPEAVEKPHFARASFRVGDRIFCTLAADGTQATLFVHPREKLYQLVEDHPRRFVTLGGWTPRHGALGLVLAEADRDQARELLEASWRRVAPKRIVAQLDGVAPPTKPAAPPRKKAAPSRKKAAPSRSRRR